MSSIARHWFMVVGLVAIGLALAGVGIYVGDTDDAPGAALGGILLMVGSVLLAVRIARRKPARHQQRG